jgi:Predicted membrane protein
MNKKEILRFVKFGLFSASAGLIEMGSFTLLNEFTSWRYWPCYLIALVLSVLWNFTLNRKYTFRSNANVKRAMALVFAYYLVFTPLSSWGGDYLAEDLCWNEYLVTVINLLVNFITEFLFQRYVVYRGEVDNAVSK